MAAALSSCTRHRAPRLPERSFLSMAIKVGPFSARGNWSITAHLPDFRLLLMSQQRQFLSRGSALQTVLPTFVAQAPSKRSLRRYASCRNSHSSIQSRSSFMGTAGERLPRQWSLLKSMTFVQLFCRVAFTISRRLLMPGLLAFSRRLRKKLAYRPRHSLFAPLCFTLIKSDRRFLSFTVGMMNARQ